MKTAAICVFVRNEERSIQEWIAYHSLIGFDSVIIYDNGSSDATVSMANAMLNVADVIVVDWSQATGRTAQADCYEDCCKRFAKQYEWIAFLDSDEFLAPPLDAKLSDLLVGKFFAAGRCIQLGLLRLERPPTGAGSFDDRRIHPPFGSRIFSQQAYKNPRAARVGPQGIESTLFRHGRPLCPPKRRVFRVGTKGLNERRGSVWMEDQSLLHTIETTLGCEGARSYRDGTVRDEGLFQVYDRNEVEDLSAAVLRTGQCADPPRRHQSRPSLWQRLTRWLRPSRPEAAKA